MMYTIVKYSGEQVDVSANNAIDALKEFRMIDSLSPVQAVRPKSLEAHRERVMSIAENLMVRDQAILDQL